MRVVSRRIFAASWRTRAWFASLSARRDSLRRLRGIDPRHVLVVCYGNIYRSAFVEHCLKSLVGSIVEVRSVGFHPVGGRQAPQRNLEMSRVYGIDLSSHRSSVVVAGDLQWADVLVLMDRKNWVRLLKMGADSEKLVWLGALAPGPVEIADPYELDDHALLRVLERLHSGTRNLATELTSRREHSATRPSASREPVA